MLTCTGSNVQADRGRDTRAHGDTHAPLNIIWSLSWLRFCVAELCSDTRLWSLNEVVLSPAASVPIRGTEEAAGARHGPHHPASEQLVSPLAVSTQSISRVSNLGRSDFLMFGINAVTPPYFHPPPHTHTHTHTPPTE